MGGVAAPDDGAGGYDGRRVSSVKPPRTRLGSSGLPLLDDFEQDVTATRQTATDVNVAPASSRTSARPMLTVVAGDDAGRVIPLGLDETVIGRGSTCHLVLPDDGVSRKHASVRRRGGAYYLADLGSKNGTYIEDERIVIRQVLPDAAFRLGPNVVVRLSMLTAAEARLASQLYESSVRDPLTQCFNRRYLFERLRSELAYAERHRTLVSLVVYDFDHFKKLNDTFGHPAGDEVLRVGTRQVIGALRTEDVLARIGGEEFAIALRGISHTEAVVCAGRVRKAIEGATGAVKATISAGVATTDDLREPTAEKLFQLADARLYEAKHAGRNRVRGRPP